jgi:acyl carrier protein
MLHETFDGLNSVQFVGFISILEREYNINLSELKAKGLEHFSEIKSKSTKPKKVFVVPKRQKKIIRLCIFG